MSIGQHIQDWRKLRKLSVSALAEKSHVPQEDLEAIETGNLDPPVSILESLAEGLTIPAAWLHYEPSTFKVLLADPDEDNSDWLNVDSADPVIAQILGSTRLDRTLFALLTTLLQDGEPKLLRAAEVNLRSLVKQSQKATVPWQSRIPGHFEPPSD